MKWSIPIAFVLITCSQLVPIAVIAECVCQGSLGMQCRGNVSAEHMRNCKTARRLILTSAVVEGCMLPWYAFPYLRSVDLVSESQYCRCLAIDCSALPTPVVVHGCTNACLKSRDEKDYAAQQLVRSNTINNERETSTATSKSINDHPTPKETEGPVPFGMRHGSIYPPGWLRRNSSALTIEKQKEEPIFQYLCVILVALNVFALSPQLFRDIISALGTDRRRKRRQHNGLHSSVVEETEMVSKFSKPAKY